MSDMMDRMEAAQALAKGERDNLLRAIALIGKHGGISVIAQDDRITTGPVIVLPQMMYDRLTHLVETDREDI